MGNMNEMKSGVYPEELVSTCGQSVDQILRKKADMCGCVAPDTEIRMADGSKMSNTLHHLFFICLCCISCISSSNWF